MVARDGIEGGTVEETAGERTGGTVSKAALYGAKTV
jgi:hypothetical protein